jgi:hypothetical protein
MEGTDREDSLRSKMRLFLFFQISQLIMCVSEHEPLRGVFRIEVTWSYHSLVEVLSIHHAG